MAGYPVKFDKHAGLAFLVTVSAVRESGTISQHGAVKLAGTFGVVANLSAVLLNEILIRCAGVIIHHLLRVIIRYKRKEKRS